MLDEDDQSMNSNHLTTNEDDEL